MVTSHFLGLYSTEPNWVLPDLTKNNWPRLVIEPRVGQAISMDLKIWAKSNASNGQCGKISLIVWGPSQTHFSL